MGVFDFLHHDGRRSIHLIGHVAGDPQLVREDTHGNTVMVFHIAEAAGTEFRLTILPTTPKRRGGDRVELTGTRVDDRTVVVDTLSSAPDSDAIRRRNAQYLHDILEQDSKERH